MALGTATAVVASASRRATPSGNSSERRPRLLVFAGNPVMVRRGGPPELPVPGVCATPDGKACDADVRPGLPAGRGPLQESAAGLAPGHESATLGPSSFDVDRAGRIHLVDALQQRVAVFRGRRLVRTTSIPMTSRADLAVAADGSAMLADERSGSVTVRRIAV